jgi:hypothetical protein
LHLAQQDAVLGEEVSELDTYGVIRDQLRRVSAFVKIDDPRRRPVENALQITERHVGSVATQRSLRRRAFLPSLTREAAPALLFSLPSASRQRRVAAEHSAEPASPAPFSLLDLSSDQSFESSALLERQEEVQEEAADGALEVVVSGWAGDEEERQQLATLEARFAGSEDALAVPHHSLRLSRIDELSVLGTPDGRSLNESIDHPLRLHATAPDSAAPSNRAPTTPTARCAASTAFTATTGEDVIATPAAQASSRVETVEHGDLREFALLAGPAAQMWGWANDMWIAWSMTREASEMEMLEEDRVEENPTYGQGRSRLGVHAPAVSLSESNDLY